MRRTLTGTLVFLIAASYLLQITVLGYEDALLLNRFYVENGEYYRLITVALLHGGLWH